MVVFRRSRTQFLGQNIRSANLRNVGRYAEIWVLSARGALEHGAAELENDGFPSRRISTSVGGQ